MTNVVLVAMNLHEVLVDINGRLPSMKLGRSLRLTLPKLVSLTGIDPYGRQAGAYDRPDGLTIAYRLRTRARAVSDGYRWVHIDSPDLNADDKFLIEQVLLTERT